VSVRARENERDEKQPEMSSLEQSMEVRINREKEPWFRSELFNRILTSKEPVVLDEAIFGISEKIGISPITARRYLQKMTSADGPLRILESKGIGLYLSIREEFWRGLNQPSSSPIRAPESAESEHSQP
jgi:hypothetical protein